MAMAEPLKKTKNRIVGDIVGDGGGAEFKRAAVDDGTAGIGVGAGQDLGGRRSGLPHATGDHAGKSTGRGGKRQGLPPKLHIARTRKRLDGSTSGSGDIERAVGATEFEIYDTAAAGQCQGARRDRGCTRIGFGSREGEGSAPNWETAPVPEIMPPKVMSSARSNATVPTLATSPTIAPLLSPAPSCNVPREIVVPPCRCWCRREPTCRR